MVDLILLFPVMQLPFAYYQPQNSRKKLEIPLIVDRLLLESYHFFMEILLLESYQLQVQNE